MSQKRTEGVEGKEKSQKKIKPVLDFEQVEERTSVEEQTSSFISSTATDSIQTHAALLGNTNIPIVQRQIMATRLGRIGGNQYLQKVMLRRHQIHEDEKKEVGEPPEVQRDLANPPPSPEATAAALSPAELRTATRYNGRRVSDPYVFAVMRDVVGVPRFPAVLDDEFVQAIARWQAHHSLTADGRLTDATTATIVEELRAEGRTVPSLLEDAELVEIESALTYNDRLRLDGRSIRILQSIIGAPTTGEWDPVSGQRVKAWQRSHGLSPVDGKVGRNTQESLINAIIAASRHDDAIHVIVDLFNFPTTHLASITYDASLTPQDAVTSGTIGAGLPQTVRVGPSTFTSGYAHMIRIIGHELQHVQQRSGASPILNSDVREFLAYAWEALAEGAPALSPAGRVNHANIAIGRWNSAPGPARTPHQSVFDRLQLLIAAGGVGSF